jgi:hypothetical protein
MSDYDAAFNVLGPVRKPFQPSKLPPLTKPHDHGNPKDADEERFRTEHGIGCADPGALEGDEFHESIPDDLFETFLDEDLAQDDDIDFDGPAPIKLIVPGE